MTSDPVIDDQSMLALLLVQFFVDLVCPLFFSFFVGQKEYLNSLYLADIVPHSHRHTRTVDIYLADKTYAGLVVPLRIRDPAPAYYALAPRTISP